MKLNTGFFFLLYTGSTGPIYVHLIFARITGTFYFFLRCSSLLVFWNERVLFQRQEGIWFDIMGFSLQLKQFDEFWSIQMFHHSLFICKSYINNFGHHFFYCDRKRNEQSFFFFKKPSTYIGCKNWVVDRWKGNEWRKVETDSKIHKKLKQKQISFKTKNVIHRNEWKIMVQRLILCNHWFHIQICINCNRF